MDDAVITSRKILLVDDDVVNSRLIASRLEKRGYKVITHELGHGVLELIDTTKAEIVLLDIMLPDISGIEVLKKIREKFEKMTLPVIMITSKDSPEDVAGALQLGANDYLAKPVNMDVAVARINTQISIRDLFRENMRRQQQDSINAMIVAFNHEINNPLAIAMGNLTLGMAKNDMAAFRKSEAALKRIAELIKKINAIAAGKEIEMTDYTESAKMVKII